MSGSTRAHSPRETAALYAVIKAIASPLRLDHVLDGIVQIATEATACHACFVYFREGDRLVMRAASPVFRHVVGKVSMGIDEGLTGWVARTGRPEFIREHALADPRMKYVPELKEEQFQSMLAVPVRARAGEVIGVIVLHTAAPREFEEADVELLVHIASLVGGAIENAELFDATRRRVDALTALVQLSQRLAAVTTRGDLYAAVNEAGRRLLALQSCHTYRVAGGRDVLQLAASDPPTGRRPVDSLTDATAVFAMVSRNGSPGGDGTRSLAGSLWEGDQPGSVLATPLVVSDELVGLLCGVADGARRFAAEEVALFGAVADQAAVGLKKIELIERLTAETRVKDLLQALTDGALPAAAAKAPEAGIDLSLPHVHLLATSAREVDVPWGTLGPEVEAGLRSRLPGALIDAGHDSLRAIVPLGGMSVEDVRRCCEELATGHGVLIAVSGAARGPEEAGRALQEASDAARILEELRPGGGAAQYDALGAYRYLVHLDARAASRDRRWGAIVALLDYDRSRGTQLVETLERFLAHGGAIASTARTLFIHPNTLRQRLDRIEQLSGLELKDEDSLSLAMALKLARLHPGGAAPDGSGDG